MNSLHRPIRSGKREAKRLLGLAMLVGGLALTAAFRPAAPDHSPTGQSALEQEVAQRLAALGITVREIDLAAAPPRIAYDQAIGEARDALALNWLLILRTAAELAPDLESLRLEMYYLGDPYLAITAEPSTLLAQDLAQAIAGLEIEELRPPEEAIRQGMALLGIPHASVAVTAETTTIHFVVPSGLAADAILELWIRTFTLAAEESPQTERILLELVHADGATSIVEAQASDVLALLNGRLDPVAFAASLTLSGGDSAQPRPSVRGSLPHAAGLAVAGAYFLAAAALVGGWVVVRLRTTLTRLQQAVLLASAAGVLVLGILIAYLSLFVPPVLP